VRAAIAIALLSTAAGAYPTMIRHGYAQCATCHTDPSGGTLLNAYGRAQSELLLSSRWGVSADEDASPRTKFLLGIVPEPDHTILGGWLRNGYIWNFAGGKLVDHRLLQMRADFAAEVRVGPLRAAGQLGYSNNSGAALAAVTRDQRVVSREHWIGVAFSSDAGLVRGGRMNVPFGLRNLEHISFVRTATQTDINQDQQDGVAVAVAGEGFRTEVMAVLGNDSLSPDAFRERGLAGYVEVSPAPRIALGVNALATRASAALGTGLPTLRQAYGVTARAAPWTPLVLSAEIDALVTSTLGSGVRAGQAGWLQADLEVLRGVHVVSAFEDLLPPAGGAVQLGGWAGLAWFVLPHLDMRADLVRRSSSDTFLIQVNGYL
jgi:hypothetical protein